MPGSVVHYLVGLALIPLLGACILAGVMVRQGLVNAKTARDVADAVHQVESINDLRLAGLTEFVSYTAVPSAGLLKLSMDQLNQRAGYRLMMPVREAQLTTDRLLRAVERRDPAGAAHIRSTLVAARAIPGSSDSTSISLPTWRSVQAFSAVRSAIDSLQMSTLHGVTTGKYGPLPSKTLAATEQLSSVAALVTASWAQTSTIVAWFGAPDAQRAGLLIQLTAATDRYAGHAQSLGQLASGEVDRAWQQTKLSDRTSAFGQLAASLSLTQRLGPKSSSASVSQDEVRTYVAQGLVANDYGRLHDTLLAVAVMTAERAAQEDRSDAMRNAVVITVGCLMLIVMTVAVLLGIGYAIRHRLRELTRAAEGLRSGQLTGVTIPGPRELEMAGQALNAAALSLQQLLASAQRLSSGDLYDAESPPPIQGPLGAAVQASVGRLASAIRERERLQQELSKLALHDPLTGLPNRVAAEAALADALAACRDTCSGLAVIFIDLDLFKSVNDTHGHAVGDFVLREAALRMSRGVRSGDVVCRFGGDEFVVVMPGVLHEDEANASAERIARAIKEPMTYDGLTLQIGASTGVCLSVGLDLTPDEMLIRADQAMYEAKNKNRNPA